MFCNFENVTLITIQRDKICHAKTMRKSTISDRVPGNKISNNVYFRLIFVICLTHVEGV